MAIPCSLATRVAGRSSYLTSVRRTKFKLLPHLQSKLVQPVPLQRRHFYRNGLADVAAISKLCPLPDTAHELTCVAKSLERRQGSIVLGKNMTETAVKQTDLTRYRIIHFATHGLLAGETAQFAKARAEPALVMSPPKAPTEEDDGLLTASEVAALKLDADWVVMSACNTAGGGEPGAEALRSRARVLLCGSPALLVSHWPVNLAATC